MIIYLKREREKKMKILILLLLATLSFGLTIKELDSQLYPWYNDHSYNLYKQYKVQMDVGDVDDLESLRIQVNKAIKKYIQDNSKTLLISTTKVKHTNDETSTTQDVVDLSVDVQKIVLDPKSESYGNNKYNVVAKVYINTKNIDETLQEIKKSSITKPTFDAKKIAKRGSTKGDGTRGVATTRGDPMDSDILEVYFTDKGDLCGVKKKIRWNRENNNDFYVDTVLEGHCGMKDYCLSGDYKCEDKLEIERMRYVEGFKGNLLERLFFSEPTKPKFVPQSDIDPEVLRKARKKYFYNSYHRNPYDIESQHQTAPQSVIDVANGTYKGWIGF